MMGKPIRQIWVKYRYERGEHACVAIIAIRIKNEVNAINQRKAFMRGSRNFHERGSNENGNFWS